jgi:hypothetical protein
MFNFCLNFQLLNIWLDSYWRNYFFKKCVGCMVWFDVPGETLNATGYVRWGPSQPDGGKLEDCIVLTVNSHLHDTACSAPVGFICERGLWIAVCIVDLRHRFTCICKSIKLLCNFRLTNTTELSLAWEAKVAHLVKISPPIMKHEGSLTVRHWT